MGEDEHGEDGGNRHRRSCRLGPPRDRQGRNDERPIGQKRKKVMAARDHDDGRREQVGSKRR